MKNTDLTKNIESLLDSLQREIELLITFGRRDKKGIKNTLSNEYISLCKYFSENPVPKIYERKELINLQNTIRAREIELKKLRIAYQKVEHLEEEIKKEFNIVVKDTLAYKQLLLLLDTMKMYLNFDRLDEYDEILKQFLDQRLELKSLPFLKDRLLIEQLENLKCQVDRIKSADKVTRLNNQINTLLTLESGKLSNNSDEIGKIRIEIDEIIHNEFMKGIHKNLLISLRKRLLNNLDATEVSLESFEKQLSVINREFCDRWDEVS